MSSWDDVTVIRKRPETSKVLKSESAVNAARRAGGAVSSEKKSLTNQQKAGLDAGKAAKIDNETEVCLVQTAVRDLQQICSFPYHTGLPRRATGLVSCKSHPTGTTSKEHDPKRPRNQNQ